MLRRWMLGILCSLELGFEVVEHFAVDGLKLGLHRSFPTNIMLRKPLNAGTLKSS